MSSSWPADSPTGIRNPVPGVNKGRHCLFPVEIKPGQYLAAFLNVLHSEIIRK